MKTKKNIHLVLFVLIYNHECVSPDEIKVIERIFKIFKYSDMRRISALVVTHCDQISDKTRSEVKMSYD